ncbi:hypothetical protein GLP30_01145 [Photobacterium phosphoreum]|uniref:DUF5666 domain-containing protein n=1 Tax=Photobacterium phosphoreum TaxID=659 RepID=A0AAW4ZMC3_PHOPO|nr:DUF5666 domain-containing protein [Photobacterium phosphoreum]MCD9461660.1 hypothetical protein [Photobacterium phosphoreum]MCD9478701.1 hypothetical protein [Photobacterium phosphoreum]MCD9483707.1 hypothetical protein [Photobacterium phosphoreum]MCD9489591.1 hypothetical protein [Photobacterium phosphoreum]MCF2188699.1 hypothetical protein [Photobacterium phosphoreum]
MKKITLATLIGLVLTGCGGGGGDDSAAPQPPVETKPQLVMGTIDRIDPVNNEITVNGMPYQVNDVEYANKPLADGIALLQPQMMVELTALTKSNVTVSIEPTMVGIISDITANTFVVNGVTLDYKLDPELAGEWVMVSSLPVVTELGLGYKVLSVIKIEKDDFGNRYELEGRLTNLNEEDQTFKIGASTLVNFSKAANLGEIECDDDRQGIQCLTNADKQWVEVSGEMQGGIFMADEVEIDSDDAEGQEVEIEGIITDINSDKTKFTLNARNQFSINHQTKIEYNDQYVDKSMLAIGSFIEVEALNGVAQEIELDSDDSNVSGFREFEKKGILENITATSFTVNGFKIDIDSQIIIDNNEKLVDLDGFRVEVEGVIIGNRYVAREIERD